jgi:ADP-heptose:LPS heptosyltransferase
LGKLVADWGYGVAITGGPSDITASGALAKKMEGPAISFAGSSLLETIKILASAAGVVAVNTGVMHLAAALDRPLVALHGPTNRDRWGPLSHHAISLGPGAPEGCAYLDLGFEYPANPPDCMNLITVEEVSAAVRSLIKSSFAH